MTQTAATFNSPDRASRPATHRARYAILAAAGLAILAGCTGAPRHSIIVGSIPDDYRTNHPIIVGEREKVLDLPVGASSYGMTNSQRTRLDGFLADYNARTAGYVAVLVPSGSLNEAAAHRAASDITAHMRRLGVSRNQIVVQPYQSPLPDASPPIRITYAAIKAYTDKCGRWPKDMLESTDNKHYANFGCSYQNNLAAQVASPTDLLGPRKTSPIDAENRDIAIGEYKQHNVSDALSGSSEVNY